MDTLVDEYDPIRSLDAFGMHVIEDNPGVQEAMSAREHSIAIRKNIAAQDDAGRCRSQARSRRRRCRRDVAAPSQESQPNEVPEAKNDDEGRPMPKAPGRMGRANANLRRKLGGVSSDVAVNVIWRMTNECRGS